jgi:hypothetical protein
LAVDHKSQDESTPVDCLDQISDGEPDIPGTTTSPGSIDNSSQQRVTEHPIHPLPRDSRSAGANLHPTSVRRARHKSFLAGSFAEKRLLIGYADHGKADQRQQRDRAFCPRPRIQPHAPILGPTLSKGRKADRPYKLLAQSQKLHPRAWLEPQAMKLEKCGKQLVRSARQLTQKQPPPVKAMDGQNSPGHCCKWQRISTRIPP